MTGTSTTRCRGNGDARPEISLAELKADLDLVEIVERYADLKRRGRELWACCPLHDDGTPSFKISADRQKFYCFGCERHGDVLDFLAYVESDTLGGVIQKRRREALGAPRKPEKPARPPKPPVEAPEAPKSRGWAQEIYRQAHPLCWCHQCAPGRAYLESRGFAEWPERLMFHPACPFDRERSPALIAPVNCAREGVVVGVWRIRLTAAGEKAERKGLGPTKGNACRLFWAEGDTLAIAEGVEDALAVNAMFGLPAWAALFKSNMADLILPARFRRVLIFADRDDDGGGVKAAHRLARRLIGEGRTAEVLRSIHHKDPNDALKSREAV